MSLLDVEALLAPAAGDHACGVDIDYDPDYLALERSIEVQPERQYGETIIPAEAPDWSKILEQSTALLQRSKDFRLVVILARALTHSQGIEGARSGIGFALAFAQRHWDDAFPRLLFDGEPDPLLRSNALTGLAVQQGLLGDLRACALPTRQMGQIEIGLMEKVANGRDGAAVSFNRGQLEQLVAEEVAHANPRLRDLDGLRDDALSLQALCRERMGVEAAPDLQPLISLIDLVLPRSSSRGASDASSAIDADADVSQGAAAVPGGGPHTRQDAIAMLDRVCAYLEQSDPANPAPLLIRRARGLIGRDFLSILRELAPEGVTQAEHLAGVRHG